MWTLAKGFLGSWSFWIATLAVVSFIGGVYLIANGRGYDRGLKVGLDHIAEQNQAREEAIAKYLREEYERQLEDNKEIETVIQERIIYRDKIVTEYQEIVAANPDTCVEPIDRVSKYNSIIDQGNANLSSDSD